MTQIPRDNVRSLLRFLSPILAERMASYRIGTPYQVARESDIEIFVALSRGPTTIADTARRLSVSRQAVHMSAKRLQALGAIAFKASKDNQRDKIIVLTPLGRQAQQIGVRHVLKLEKEIANIIGAKGLESFRTMLHQLVEGLPQQKKAAPKKSSSSKSK